MSTTPCSNGEWIVHGSTPGTGLCAVMTNCPLGEVPVLALEGGMKCSCPDGTHKRGDRCHHLFTQANCNEGELLLPENIRMGQQECSNKFSCMTSDQCYNYQLTKTELADRNTQEYNNQREYLRDLVCHKESHSICCPEDLEGSLMTTDILLASLIPSRAVCSPNPCPSDKWPFKDSEGKVMCFKKQAGVDQCIGGDLELEDETIICNILETRSLIFKRIRCGRRRAWRLGKCRRIFSN